MDKKYLLSLARKAVKSFVNKQEPPEPKKESWLSEKRGVFVTLHTYPENELRGCIGYPGPHRPLGTGIVRAATQACQDPRFEPLKKEELDKIIIEISVLTVPEKLEAGDPDSLAKKIETGKHGLIIQKNSDYGLLLPQVAKEHGLDVHEFLIQACLKAGIRPTAWMEPETRVYTFEAEVFSEEKPGKT